MSLFRVVLGRRGEDLAARHLRKHGYRVICRNYRTRRGEIDIVAMDGDTVVFVEVRTRSGPECGTPEESVTARKAAHLQKAAQVYLSRHGLENSPARFDFVGVDLSSGRPVLNLLRDCLSSSP